MAQGKDPPRIDSSNEQSYMASYGMLLEGRSDSERVKLLTAIYKIEAAARESRTSPVSADEFTQFARQSVHGMSYAEILDRGDALTTPQERKLAVLDEKGRTAYDSLSEPERVVWTVTRLLFCIRDGGLASYFYNGYAVHLVDCMQSLEILGASEMREALRKTSRQFRNGEPTLLAMLGGFFATAASEARESEQELQLANSVEAKLNEYAAEQGL